MPLFKDDVDRPDSEVAGCPGAFDPGLLPWFDVGGVFARDDVASGNRSSAANSASLAVAPRTNRQREQRADRRRRVRLGHRAGLPAVRHHRLERQPRREAEGTAVTPQVRLCRGHRLGSLRPYRLPRGPLPHDHETATVCGSTLGHRDRSPADDSRRWNPGEPVSRIPPSDRPPFDVAG